MFHLIPTRGTLLHGDLSLPFYILYLQVAERLNLKSYKEKKLESCMGWTLTKFTGTISQCRQSIFLRQTWNKHKVIGQLAKKRPLWPWEMEDPSSRFLYRFIWSEGTLINYSSFCVSAVGIPSLHDNRVFALRADVRELETAESEAASQSGGRYTFLRQQILHVTG